MLKTGIEYRLNITNFNFSCEYKLIVCGKKLTFKKKKSEKKKKSSEKIKTAEEKKRRKIGLSDIKKIKPSVFAILDALLEICKRCVVFDNFGLKIVCALDNPASNGMLYGGLQSVLNVVYAYFLANCNVKNSDLNINCDFKSSEGLIIENCGKIYVRPTVVLFNAVKILICEKGLMGHIKNLKDFFVK